MALGFGRVHDTALLEPYVERYHAALRDVWDARTYAMAANFVVVLYPIALASQEFVDATEQWLAQNQDAPAGLVRLVAENRDIVRVALTAQARDEA